MKDKRNCGGQFPMYGGMPMPLPIPTPYQTGFDQGYVQNSVSSNTIEQQLNNLFNQINNLEARVTNLENKQSSGNTTTYNDSNYYMV